MLVAHADARRNHKHKRSIKVQNKYIYVEVVLLHFSSTALHFTTITVDNIPHIV